MNKKIYRANWLLPVSGPPIPDGALCLQDGKILDIGPARKIIHNHSGISVSSFENSVIVPSWVNTHCHLELSLFHKKLDGSSGFVNWINQLLDLKAGSEPNQVLEFAELAAHQLKQSGCALVGDVTNGDLIAADAIRNSPQRVVLYEILGFMDSKAQAIYETAKKRIDDENPVAQIIGHALYSTSAELLQLIGTRTEVQSIHLAESAEETEFIRHGGGDFRKLLELRGAWVESWQPPGISPVQFFSKLNLLSSKSLLVHGIQVTQEDIELITKSGATVCICARSNNFLNTGDAPLEAYLKNNTRLALGTDSLASNIDIDMNNEIYYIHKKFRSLPAHKLIEMATINGAHALAKNKEYGSLEVGKIAHFNIFSSKNKIEIDPAEFVVSKSWSSMKWF